MRNEKVLEMLNNGEVEELKQQIKDKIYTDTLDKRTGAKQRYTAMKRYLRHTKDSDQKWMRLVTTGLSYYGDNYNGFTDDCNIVFTNEGVGELKSSNKGMSMIDNFKDVLLEEGKTKVNFKELLAKAKTEGYKYTKNNNRYIIKFEDVYVNMKLLDLAVSIIDDGGDLYIHKRDDEQSIVLKNEIGVVYILGMRVLKENDDCVHIDWEETN